MSARLKKILVVDDDRPVLNYLTRMLALMKYKVTSAVDAVEALRKKPESFDLVISDLSLPQKSGLWLLSRVRDKGSKIKFMLMSGNADPEELRELKKYEMTRFIRKPFKIEELMEIMEELSMDN